jgi:spore maturation protein CgeB
VKIAVIGVATPSNLESFLAQGFRDLGHQTVIFDAWENRGHPLYHRYSASLLLGLPRIRHWYNARYLAHVNVHARRFLEAERPDFVIVHNGALLQPETIQAVVHRFHIPFATYAADDPTLGIMLPDYLPCLPYFTHVFACETALIPKLNRLTTNRVEFLPAAAPPDLYYPITPPESERQLFDCNLGYVSTGYSGSPYGVYRALLLKNVADLGLKIFGDRHWDYIAHRVPGIAPYIHVTGFLSPERMRAFFASTRIFMGVVHPQIVTGAGQRLFDAAAAGAFVLAEYKADIERLFPQGEIETFKDKEEMREKAIYYLAHPEQRREKAAAARARVLAEHTWQHRAREILEVVFE